MQQNDIRSVTMGGRRDRRHVLVVEDSDAQRHMICAMLRGWNFTVSVARSGAQALALCHRNMPDLVISDWIMPGMSGPDFCRAFRVLLGEDYSYFILLTSKNKKSEVATGLDAGADDFLIKPVHPVELRARLAAGLRILDMERELKEKNRLLSQTLTRLQEAHAAIDRDLVEARELQKSLIGRDHVELGAGTVSMSLLTCGQIGGDLVGFLPTDDNKLVLFAIDVSGHGISSALMSARMAGVLSASVKAQNLALRPMPGGGYAARPPRETVSALNRHLLEEMEVRQFLTMNLAVIDLASFEVTMTQAGHPPPAILSADGDVRFVGKGGLPVGLLPEARYQQIGFQLQPRDRLIIYSDGFDECRDPDGRALGSKGLAKLIAGMAPHRGKDGLDHLIAGLRRFRGADNFDDDISVIEFARTATAAPRA